MSAGNVIETFDTGEARERRGDSPRRLLLMTAAIIFLAGCLAMGLLYIVDPESYPVRLFLDACIITGMAFPALYCFSHRPLLRALAAERCAQDSLRRYKGTQAATYAVTTVAVSQLDPESLLESVIDKTLPLVGADAAWVTEPGVGPDDLPQVLACRGVSDEFVVAECSSPLNRCPICRPLLEGKTSAINVVPLPECPRLPSGILARAGLRSHLGVPLAGSSGGLAILNLAWTGPHDLSTAERTMLATIGNQVGIALEKCKLYQAEAQARRRSEALRKGTLAVAKSLELTKLLTAMLENLRELIPCDRALVRMLEGPSGSRVVAVVERDGTVDLPHGPLQAFEEEEHPFIRAMLTSGTSVVVPDMRAEEPWCGPPGSESQRSWMGVPLFAGGKLIGLYSISKAEPGFFTEDHVALAEALAAPAAVALRNAALFEQVRCGQERLQALSRQLVELQEREQRAIARELHDEAGQALTTLKVGLRLLQQDESCPEPIAGRAAALLQIADGVQDGLHRLASNLHPASLDHLGLVGALRNYLHVGDRRSGLQVLFESVGLDGVRLPAALETALYRVAQEAVTNTVRHAQAKNLSVLLELRDAVVVLVVEDDGVGFDSDAAPRGGRLGLVGMQERVEMLGGRLLVESAPGIGTTIVVEIPCGHTDSDRG